MLAVSRCLDWSGLLRTGRIGLVSVHRSTDIIKLHSSISCELQKIYSADIYCMLIFKINKDQFDAKPKLSADSRMQRVYFVAH